MRPMIRTYRGQDLGRVVQLVEADGVTAEAGDALSLDDIAGLVESDRSQTFVAEIEGAVVAVATGAAMGPVGSIFHVAGDHAVLDRLIGELERCLADHGARTFTAAARHGEGIGEVLDTRGYTAAEGTAVFHRHDPPARTGLVELGGQTFDEDLWDQLEGMEEVKDVIERRIILPLAHPGLADRHGVLAPQSVVLFGPPGTGKTTFAKGVASRLRWPFVPVEAAALAGEGGDDPTLLAEAFDRLLAAPAAVAFFDEVEDLASDRQDERRVSPRVTNEFLRQLPRMRESYDHLLVCATNSVGSLDPAFLRPGRFDYVLPVGPPDDDARASIWRRYVTDITDEDVDVQALVAASERFTPADIEFAARKAAQFAFEGEYFGQSERRAGTDQFLTAIRQTRPTLTDRMVAAFDRDVEAYARD